MHHLFKAALLPVLAVAGQASLFAQLAPTRPDPADPHAAAAPQVYRSPLSGYHGFAEPVLAPWKASNDAVLQRGGWRAYAKESQEPAAQPASAASSASMPEASTRKPAMPGHQMN